MEGACCPGRRRRRRDPYRLIGDGHSLSVEDATHLSAHESRRPAPGRRDAATIIIVFHRHAPVLALPRTAFPPAEIATAFADFLRSRIDLGHRPQTNRDPP